MPTFAAFVRIECSTSVKSRSFSVVLRRVSLTRSKWRTTRSSALASFTACTAPNASPSSPVTSPMDSWLARRYRSIRLLARFTITKTNKRGMNTVKVSSGSIRASTASAMIVTTIWPTGSRVHVRNWTTTCVSSRKRLIASPAEAGTARAPGCSSIRASKFLRSNAAAVSCVVVSAYTARASAVTRAKATATSSASKLHTSRPA